MKQVKHYLNNLIRDEKGLTTVEYAIAGGLVGAVVVTAFTSLGTTIVAKIQAIITAIT